MASRTHETSAGRLAVPWRNRRRYGLAELAGVPMIRCGSSDECETPDPSTIGETGAPAAAEGVTERQSGRIQPAAAAAGSAASTSHLM
eukprot:scaffold160682_cov26-Tisochrysis_lutea.AAC.3